MRTIGAEVTVYGDKKSTLCLGHEKLAWGI